MPTVIDPLLRDAITEIKAICARPESKSQFFPFGGEAYKSSVRHYLESSCEIAACAVQPGSITDLCEIMKVIKKFRVQFAVKGGGHATNPHFSSTTGIQISMCRFNSIRIEKDTSSFAPSLQSKHTIVHVGAGSLFDEVYREVVPHGLNIVGGSSIGGVGIAGWLLGGGYSLKANQHGLGIDNVLRVQIVLPSGETRDVSVLSQGEDKELFEAVKGGGNNFGIVTEFTIRAHVQTGSVFGGLLVYQPEDYDDVKVAIANFARQTDPEASLVAAFRYSNNSGVIEPKLTVQCYYDGPKPGSDPFAEFLDIEHRNDEDGADSVGFQFIGGAKGNSSDGVSGRSQRKNAPGKTLREYSSYGEFDEQFTLVGSVMDVDSVDIETILQTTNTLSLFTQNGLFSAAMTPALDIMNQSDALVKGALALVPPLPSKRSANNGVAMPPAFNSAQFLNPLIPALPMAGAKTNSRNVIPPVAPPASDTKKHSTTQTNGFFGSVFPGPPVVGAAEKPRYASTPAAPASNARTDPERATNGSINSLLPQATDSIKRAMAGVGENPRGRWGNVMIDVYTKEVIDEIAYQASKVSAQMTEHGGKRVVVDIWPFTSNMFDNSTPAAWPHTKGMPNGPILAYFLWEGTENDRFWIDTLKDVLSAIKAKVNKARGRNAKPLPVYLNTTLDSTTVEEIYGENLGKLSKLRQRFDPDLVMNLTGGFKIPHPREISASW